MDILLRHATLADIPALCALEKECFTLPWQEDSFAFALNNPSLFFLPVLTAGEEIVGYAVMQCLFEEAELQNIAVKENFRNSGFGKRILQACFDEATAKNAEKMYLEVREGNMPARTLYEKNGFCPYARRRNYYKEPTEDAIMMVKSF